MSISFVLKVKRISLSFRHVYVNMVVGNEVIDQPIDLSMLLALRNHLGYVPLFRSTAGLHLTPQQKMIANKADQFPVTVTEQGQGVLNLAFPSCYQKLFRTVPRSKSRQVVLTIEWSVLDACIEQMRVALKEQIEPRKAYRFDIDFEQELNNWVEIQSYLDDMLVSLVDYSEFMELRSDPRMLKAAEYGGLIRSPRYSEEIKD